MPSLNLLLYVQVPKDPDLGSDAERVRKEEQKKIDEVEPLTEEELAEKEDLLKSVSLQLEFWKNKQCNGQSSVKKFVILITGSKRISQNIWNIDLAGCVLWHVTARIHEL